MSEAVATRKGRTIWSQIVAILRLLFVPNQYISWRAQMFLVAGQVVALACFWWNSPTVFIPALPDVMKAFGYLWMKRGLSHEIFTSFTLILEAMGWMVLISAVICYLHLLRFFGPLAKLVGALRFLSTVGLGLLVNIYLTDPHTKKLAIMVFFMVAIFVPSFIIEIRRIPEQKYHLARTLRMNEWTIVNEVVVRGQFSKFIDCALLAGCMGFMLLTMVERMFREEGGVGVMLSDAEKHFSLDQIWAIQLSLLCLGLGFLDLLGNRLNRWACPYAFMKLERR